MIKVNVIVKNKPVEIYKNPEAYLKKIKIQSDKFFRNKNIVLALNYLIQMRLNC